MLYIFLIKMETYYIYHFQRIFPPTPYLFKLLSHLVFPTRSLKGEISARVVISIMSVHFFSLTDRKEIIDLRHFVSDRFSNDHHQKVDNNKNSRCKLFK